MMPSTLKSPKYPASVTVTKADNGFVVSCYGEKGEQKKVAKTMKEALDSAEEMMGVGDGPEVKRIKAKLK